MDIVEATREILRGYENINTYTIEEIDDRFSVNHTISNYRLVSNEYFDNNKKYRLRIYYINENGQNALDDWYLKGNEWLTYGDYIDE